MRSKYIAKDCLLTGQERACTRINWLFVCLFVRQHAEHISNGSIQREMVVDCPQSETLFQTRQDQDSGPVSLLCS